MRIIHVGNFGARAKGASLHGVGVKLSNGLVRNGHYVFNFADREVARTATVFRNRKLGRRGANRALLDLCAHFGPDMVIFGHADVIAPETIIEIRARHKHVRMFQWNVDPLFEPDNVARINSKIDVLDATFITTAGADLKQFERPKHVVGFMPNPTDPSIERGENFRRDDLEYDLFYAVGRGSLPRHHCGHPCDVEELARRIQAAFPELRPLFLGMFGAGNVAGITYQRVLESARMGLNLSRRSDVYLYSSNRMAHLVGNGILTFIDRATGFGELFGEDELAFYGTEAELFDKLRLYQNDDAERRRVAERGWRKYHRIFGCEVVAKYLIDAVEGKVDPARFDWAA